MADFNEAEVIVSQRGWLGQTLPWFQRLVLDRSQIQDFRAGTTICRVGDPLTGMHGLVSGGLLFPSRLTRVALILLTLLWRDLGLARARPSQTNRAYPVDAHRVQEPLLLAFTPRWCG